MHTYLHTYEGNYTSGNPDKHPNILNPDKYPNTRNPDEHPNTRNPDKHPNIEKMKLVYGESLLIDLPKGIEDTIENLFYSAAIRCLWIFLNVYMYLNIYKYVCMYKCLFTN